MELIKHSDLEAVLQRSEAHALKCTIDNGMTSCIFRVQIEKGYITMAVSSKMVKKAIRALDIFLRRMYREGFSLIVDCNSHYHSPASAIIVDREVIPIRMKEKQRLEDASHGTWHYKRYVPTGVLALEIYGGTKDEPTKVLMETNDSSWDVVSEDIIPYLRKAAKQIRENRLEVEEQQRKWQEEERKRKEHLQMIMDRASAVKSIMHDVFLYEKAEVIRRYCNLAETLITSDEYKDKVAAARRIADWLDPTNSYVDEILSEKYRAEDFL